MPGFLRNLPGLITWIRGMAPGFGGLLPPQASVNLPQLNAPVPLGESAAIGGKNTALILQPGQYLYAGCDVAPTTGSAPSAVSIVVQGGYYGRPGLPPGPSPGFFSAAPPPD